MEKKYRTEKDPETGLLRIIALKDFSDVKKGDRGGLIAKEDNLSQEGNCWVYEHAKVGEKAWICDNAKIYGKARIYAHAQVFGEAEVYGHTEIKGDVKVSDNTEVKQ